MVSQRTRRPSALNQPRRWFSPPSRQAHIEGHRHASDHRHLGPRHSPIGTLNAVMTFQDEQGVLSGFAASRTEDVPLRDLRVATDAQEDHVMWTQTITTPMRLELAFDVTIDGDRMTGDSRAGRLPRSTVTGVRRVP